MSETKEVIELELIPIPPDTTVTVNEELMPLIKAALHEAGQDHLLSDKHIQVQVQRPFPTDAAIIVGLTFLSQIALETYKTVILPWLQRRFQVRERSKPTEETGETKK